MLAAILEGFWVGIAMLIFIGPVFFTLLQAAFQYGFKAGWAVAWGIFVSDIVCVLLCKWGIVQFILTPTTSFWIGVVGAILLMGMGVFYWINARKNSLSEINLSTQNQYISLFVRGFLVNFVNPFVFFIWIGVSSRAIVKYPDNSFYYLTFALLGIFLTDSLKAFFAHKIKTFLKPNILLQIYRVIGCVLIVFAFVLLYRITYLPSVT